MPTLHLRNVPAEVVERLTRLAEREHTSVSAIAIRELADISRRADDPALLAALPDTGIPIDEVVDAVDAGRADR
ncbi:antitoxin [Blastococcus sp. KM273128]|uniref:antitoxin n=1 Tax=Blastococcus sp. KM273128 TaxID=2570314 RepID=UPI001F160797|nr:antitoxin [Blastococcus sp. KM273128]MCF6746178.1 antitoxin [Blastococcus sp. KM273128]